MKYAVSGLILFFGLTFLVSLGFLKTFDLNVTLGLQKIISPALITPLSLFTIIGSIEFASIVLLILFYIFPKLNKLSVLLMFGIFSVIEVFGKSFIGQKPPPLEFLKTDIHLFLPISSIPKEFFSYPSGHSSRTAFISGILLIAIWQLKISKSKKYLLSAIILLFDLIMFVSRIYLGEHWATDVIGGLILGFSFALLSPFLSLKIKK